MSIKLEAYATVIDSLERGETIRVNHQHCPAGIDTKRRLYLTRHASTPGVVLAFCHNCQDSGVVRDKLDNYRDSHRTKPNKNQVQPVNFFIPQTMERDTKNWPHDAQVWRIQKRLTHEDCLQMGIQYDPSSNRIYLPIYTAYLDDDLTTNGTLLGFQLRQIDGTGPKYYTAYKDKSTKPYTYLGKVFSPKHCILVEDLASGIRVNHMTNENVGVLVNYGVKVTPEVLSYMSGTCTNFVWLDNDNQYIKDQSAIISRTWELISGRKCYPILSTNKDPKDHTEEEMADLMKRYGM